MNIRRFGHIFGKMEVKITPETLKSPFIYRFPLETSGIKPSIERFGLIEPVVFVKKGQDKALFDGGRRVKASLELGWEYIEGVVTEGDPDELFFKKIVKDISLRELNPVEKAHVVSHFQGSPLASKVFQLLSVKERSIPLYIKLSGLKEGTKELFLRWRLTESILGDAVWEWFKDINGVFEVLSELPLNAKHFKEILSLAGTISRKHKKESLRFLKEVLERIPKTLPSPGKLSLLKGILANLRYPQLRAWERGVVEIVERVKKESGGKVAVHPPPFFEGRVWRMECSFSSGKELGGAIKALEKIKRTFFE